MGKIFVEAFRTIIGTHSNAAISGFSPRATNAFSTFGSVAFLHPLELEGNNMLKLVFDNDWLVLAE